MVDIQQGMALEENILSYELIHFFTLLEFHLIFHSLLRMNTGKMEKPYDHTNSHKLHSFFFHFF